MSAKQPTRGFKPGDKIRVNLHHGKIEDAALLLSDGHAPRHIANTLGVTENTVRSQIKSIFPKTGLKRQGELIRLLQNKFRNAHATKADPLRLLARFKIRRSLPKTP